MCPNARARVIMVRDCVPATPPMLGTMGIRIASRTILSRAVSKISTTDAARNAVAKLTPSHMALFLALLVAGENKSSSSSRPAALISECSASSLITSTTSSIVIRPRSLF